MWPLPIFSEGKRLLAVFLAAGAVSWPVSARVYLTQEEALSEVFSDRETIVRRTAFLTEDQAERIRRDSGRPLESRVVTYYLGTMEDGGEATLYFATHRVRTLPETILILVDSGGRVLKLQVVSFLEPPDYLPRRKWLEQFHGRALGEDLSLKRGIHTITGATLSARAVTRAVREILAIHRALGEGESERPTGPSRQHGGIR